MASLSRHHDPDRDRLAGHPLQRRERLPPRQRRLLRPDGAQRKVTTWASSYDGRNKEPVTFPVKFPVLLAQGAEGIAVGLSTKILPHNFNEIIDGMIDGLRKNPINLLPDFPQGGIADCTDYNGGARGGRVRVRARIEKVKKHLLKITEIPYGTTTTSLIDSILSANDKSKIKIAKIEDNTAEFVEIMIHLPSTVSAEDALPALYAFTDRIESIRLVVVVP